MNEQCQHSVLAGSTPAINEQVTAVSPKWGIYWVLATFTKNASGRTCIYVNVPESWSGWRKVDRLQLLEALQSHLPRCHSHPTMGPGRGDTT